MATEPGNKLPTQKSTRTRSKTTAAPSEKSLGGAKTNAIGQVRRGRPSMRPWSADLPPSVAAREMCRVAVSQIVHRTDPNSLGEEPRATDSLFDLVDPIAQRALLLGLTVRERGFHVFVATDPEVRIEADIVGFAQRHAATAPSARPLDLAYVHDFERPEAPRSLRLPGGTGPDFVTKMAALIEHLSTEIPELLDLDVVKRAQAHLAQKLDDRSRQIVTGLESTAKTLGFGVRTVAGSLQTFPILHGKPLSAEQLAVLDESTKKALAEGEDKLTREVTRAAELVQRETRKFEQAREEAFGQAARRIVGEAIAALAETCLELGEDAQAYLARVRDALCEDWADFVETKGSRDSEDPTSDGDDERDTDPEHATRLRRFRVNLLVTHPEGARAPVVYETNPTYPNLFGYLERRAKFGALLTDFTRVRAGALHRASGGILVVRAADLLADPIIWERFKRVLRERQLGAEDPLGPLGLYATTLRPVPLPIEVRVVLIGPPNMYAALLDADPDFAALFRVKVEVASSVPRTSTSLALLDGYLMHMAKQRGWGSFERGGRAVLLDLASRLAAERDRLTLCLQPLEETAAFAGAITAARDLSLPDADDVPVSAGSRPSFRTDHVPMQPVTADDVSAAFRERRERSGAAERQFREMVLSSEITIETAGLRVGCINGLSVLSTGDVEFGQPMRITAVVALGREGVIDVEREAQLSGAIHTKGMAILRGYLSRIFGQERPLSLRAQIAFEQSYGEVDGDSASAAELFVLLSSLSEVGIDQSIALTGSINQLGTVQAIGGVCAKIEGFFDLCVARGLSGAQGVMIPRTNLQHLVLRDDVVAAIEAGRFHLYAIDNVQQGIEILTGLPAGERDGSGHFPASSVFGRVERRIIEIAERLRVAEHASVLAPSVRESVDDLSKADLGDAGDFVRAPNGRARTTSRRR